MIEKLRAAWPARPVSLRPPIAAWRMRLLGITCFLMAAGIFAYVGYGLAPAIIDDVQMRDRARVVQMARIEGGRCSSRLAIIHSCDATIAATTKEGVVRQSLHHLFFDFHTGNWTARVMADPARPGIFATDIGLDRIWHRVGTALFIALIGLFVLAAPWGQIRRAAAERRRVKALSAQGFSPVALGIQGWQGQVVTVVDPRGGAHRWTMPAKTTLFGVGAGQVLGVAAPGGEAFPLDEKLRWADFTTHERAALKQARTA